MNDPMKCPGCGGLMNHHADKIMYTEGGETLEEFYQCPGCGTAASRQAEDQLV